MTDREFIDKLTKIGYSKLWLDFGVLNLELLEEQTTLFDNNDDKNTEHYRYFSFKQYLSSKNDLSDTEFDNYLKLVFADSDSVMASSAALELFKSVELTEQQFQRLCTSIRYFGNWTEKIVTRQTLLRKLKSSNLTDELFNECIKIGDSFVQEHIIDLVDANKLQELSIKGKNKKIRTMASERLNKIS